MLPWQRKSIFVMRVLYHSFMLDIFVPPPPLPRREESGLGVRRRKCRKRHFELIRVVVKAKPECCSEQNRNRD